MAKLRLTKNELKRQKDALRRFQHFLPVLQLKKQQLQLEIMKVHISLKELEAETEEFKRQLYKWIAVFGEGIKLEGLVVVKEVCTKEGNVAGVDMPIFEKVEFKEEAYDFMRFPLWVDYGIEAVKEMLVLKIRREILEKQEELIAEELRITTQRVNLFEKVKIPESKENIRRIRIWLGDQQTVAVVTGKIAKAKIQKKEGVLV